MITFRPDAGDVLMCDFAGNLAPEIVKRRPVVVLASHRDGAHVVTVVPLSLTQPFPIEAWHVPLVTAEYAFLPDVASVIWAKADLLTHVSFQRLDRLRLHGSYSRCRLSDVDFAGIRLATAAALGLELRAPGAVRAA